MTAEELQQLRNSEALAIWREHDSDFKSSPGRALMPLLAEKFVPNADLLFVGMNPSFSRESLKKLVREFFGDLPVDDAFAWDSTKSAEHVEALIRLDTKSLSVYKTFYGPLQEFSVEVGATSHAHVDMFLVRLTSQKEFGQTHGKRFEALGAFALSQFELFQLTMRHLDPKVIVIANAGASQLALKGLKLESFDNGLSYRWATLPAVPIFLSGMLSGQRALDVFSKARLARDVKAALRALRERKGGESYVDA